MNPELLGLHNLILQLLGKLNDVVLLGLHGSSVLIVTALLLELSPDPIELVNPKLLLVDDVVPLLDLLLEVVDLLLAILELSNEIVEFLG